MRRLDLAPKEQRRQAGPERQGEPNRKRRAQPLLPDELEASDDADADDEGCDRRPAGTGGRNLTVERFAHLKLLRPDARSGRILRSPRIVIAKVRTIVTPP